MTELKTIEKFRDVNKGYPYTEPIRDWKEKGGKVVGFHCLYTPVEIIHAAGILPVRLSGGFQEIEAQDAVSYLYSHTCTNVLQLCQLVLDNKWDFLDGFVSASSCDFFRRLSDHWEVYFAESIPLISQLSIPRKASEYGYEYYTSQLLRMKQGLEGSLGVNISDEALRSSISLFSRTRELLSQLYELRKRDNPPVSGAEVQEVLNAAFCMPREQYNSLLEDLLVEIDTTGKAIDCSDKVRLMIYGSPLSNPDFIKCIEDEGAIVVVDEMCTGLGTWYEFPQEDYQNPVQGLSRSYINKAPCPRQHPQERRFEIILRLIEEYKVDGLVCQIIRCCTPYQHDQVSLAPILQEKGYPMLRLDTEYGVGHSGQLTTRAQAFVEMLRSKKYQGTRT
jgi:bcr-type benzoyl-CoA reductase subunit C